MAHRVSSLRRINSVAIGGILLQNSCWDDQWPV